MRDFNVKTSSPDEDRLETVLHFVGDTFPRVFVINRLGREVDYVTVDEARYERVVLCSDCKHYHPEMYNNINCEWFMFDVEPDGFCAWGERKEGGE